MASRTCPGMLEPSATRSRYRAIRRWMTSSTDGWSRPSHVRTISGSDSPASSSKYSWAERGRPYSAKRSLKISQRIGSSCESVPLKSNMTARTGTAATHYRRRVPLTALALALAAAFVHALWNLLLAHARDIEAATAVALVVAVVAFAFPAAAFWRVDGRVWPYLVGSAGFELVYFALLATAYRRAEFSVVYPIARGSAPVLVLVVAVAVLRASTSWQQAAGVALVAGGIVFVRGFQRGLKRGGVAFGLTIGCCIAGYTLIDKYGIRYASPVSYLELSMVAPSLAYAVAVASRKGLVALRGELNLASAVAGLATFGAYALVLAALKLASAASVAAVRETSVVIAIALAGVFLNERVGWARIVGAVVIAAGIGLVSLG